MSNTTYDSLISQAASQYGVPFGLLKALLMSESSLDPNAGRGTEYQGIAQFWTGTWGGNWNPFRNQSPYDPNAAIFASALYLKNLWSNTGNIAEALALYKGFGNKGGYGNPRAKELVDKVLWYFDKGYSVNESSVPDYAEEIKSYQRNVWKRKLLPDEIRKIETEIAHRGEPTPMTQTQAQQSSIEWTPGVSQVGGVS
jgi:hypothetical protein